METYQAESLSVKADAQGIVVVAKLQPSEELRPTFYVKHPDDTFTEANPQPGTDLFTSVKITDEQARELSAKLAHFLVTR